MEENMTRFLADFHFGTKILTTPRMAQILGIAEGIWIMELLTHNTKGDTITFDFAEIQEETSISEQNQKLFIKKFIKNKIFIPQKNPNQFIFNTNTFCDLVYGEES